MFDPISVADRLAIDAHLARAWPAIERRRIGDFELRFGGGYGRRSNSARVVHPRIDPVLAEASCIEQIEAAYRASGQRPAFYVVPSFGDEALVARLEARGYEPSESFFVWAGDIEAILAHEPKSDAVVRLPEADADAMAETLTSVEDGKAGEHRRLAALLEHTTCTTWLGTAIAARSSEAPALAAAALGVLDGHDFSIHELVTARSLRRRGYAHDLVLELVRAAARAGARRACAQIAAHNRASEALFESLSFERLHGYRYLVSPSV